MNIDQTRIANCPPLSELLADESDCLVQEGILQDEASCFVSPLANSATAYRIARLEEEILRLRRALDEESIRRHTPSAQTLSTLVDIGPTPRQ